MRKIEFRNILKPSVEYLERCHALMLDTNGMSEFLGVPLKVMTQLVCTGRIPPPCRLGIGSGLRWNVLELLEWIEMDCPRRTEWIRLRRTSGMYRRLQR